MTAVSSKNPFRPGVGTRPLHLAGRDASIRRFRAMLRAAPEQPANMHLTGLRGVGKTVLLGEFARSAEEMDWVHVMLELQSGHNAEEDLLGTLAIESDRLHQRLSRLRRVKERADQVVRRGVESVRISYGDLALTVEPGASARVADLAKVLGELVVAAGNQGRAGVMVLLDEAQVLRDESKATGEHPLSMLISAVVSLQREEIPLGLVLCGLPTLTGNLLRARSYTERMFRGESIGSLERNEAMDAFAEPLRETAVSAEDALVERVVDEVEGYPYFVQLWGAELWDAAVDAGFQVLTPALLDVITPEIYARLDSDFYEPRVMTLTPAEQDLLLATAEVEHYPPLLVSEVNAASDKTPGNINVLLGRLVDAGVIYRLRKGQYEYTAPKFRQYLLRRAS